MPDFRAFWWRGRMGVEPTGAGIADARTVLKTGEATGPHPPPQIPFLDGGQCSTNVLRNRPKTGSAGRFYGDRKREMERAPVWGTGVAPVGVVGNPNLFQGQSTFVDIDH